ncbi:tetratricopeptide repeat protein [Streptomyces virginiae]|uniref:tetratricopeptide repeat protein n=1 Tax=Streptomyces virginiae TaxID=1961 RepID=UPI003660515E
MVETAAGGRSGLLVLVGPSSTGKTRACWEAVQILSDRGWRLWHPFDPSRAEAALASIQQVRPHTVVWLNEAQHYLGDTHHGETLAAALRALLTDQDRGPVLVLGTLWPEYEREYSALPQPGRPDPYGQVRELLTGRTVSVPDTFDQAALEAARLIADGGDTLLAAALQRAPDGRVAQDLAGAPELLRRYRSASAPARCLLHAAMDARRLGVGLHLPIDFLADAAADYFSDHEYDLLANDWVDQALDELTKPVHGHLAPLRRSNPRRTSRAPRTASSRTVTSTQAARYRLADYLEEHGRKRRSLYPPASFWQAAHDHITDIDDLERLGSAAFERHRLQWAYHLYALVPASRSLVMLALIRQIVGDLEEAERLLVRACAAGDQQALLSLAHLREEDNDQQGAEHLFRQAAAAGNDQALKELARLRLDAGDTDSATQFLTRAAKSGDVGALKQLAWLREKTGDKDGAESLLARRPATTPFLLMELARLRAEGGDQEGAERLLSEVVEAGRPYVLIQLAGIRLETGDPAAAERLLTAAADGGPPEATRMLAHFRQHFGHREEARQLLLQAAYAGSTHAMLELLDHYHGAGEQTKVDEFLADFSESSDPFTLIELAIFCQETGDLNAADSLLTQACASDDVYALLKASRLRLEAGNEELSEELLRRAADIGDWGDEVPDEFAAMWPFGLDADGTPTPPW